MTFEAGSEEKLAVDGGTPVRQQPFQAWPIWDEREEQALLRTLRSGLWGAGGEETELLEREFARWHSAHFALTVPTGTAALEVALRAAGVSYGDEVIVPPYTFIATAAACLLVGAIPVFADIDPETCTLAPDAVAATITERTRAIIPVHIGGYPADMDRLVDLARRHDLRVIEDACQAQGACWRDRPVGTIGNVGCFSFQSSKNINAGEGGMVLTDDPELAERCWEFKNCGRVRDGAWYRHDSLGTNFRMAQFQAAVLRVQLSRMEEWAARRAENGDYLTAGLREIGGLVPQRSDARVTRHAYHLVIVRYQPEAFGGWSRERFTAALQAEGIPATRGYVPLYCTGGIQTGTQKLRQALKLDPAGTPYVVPDCPVTEKVCDEEGIWLGSQSALLGTRADMDDILKAVAKIRRAAQTT